MTEAEWLTSTEPRPILAAMKGWASERKFRLFAVACRRRAWHLMADTRSRRLVEAAERFADGTVSAGDWAAASAAGERAYHGSERAADVAKRRMLDERAGDLGLEAACHAAGAAYDVGHYPDVGAELPANPGWVSSSALPPRRLRPHRPGAPSARLLGSHQLFRGGGCADWPP